MIKFITGICERYREAILYLIFGVLTTAVNYAVYIAADGMSPFNTTTVPTAIAWIVAVLFAYFTNRKWVFASKAAGAAAAREFCAFIGARVLSGLMDIAVMYIAVDMLGFNDKIIKLASNVIVVVVNYVISKLWVFKKS